MSDLYKEFQGFCSTQDDCKNCKYKDVKYCTFYWSADKARAEERERIISEIKKWYWDSDKQRLADDPCVVDAMIDLFIRTVRGEENET